MTIFKVGAKAIFLEDVTEIVIKNYASDFSNLKIILPNGLACSAIQKIIINKLDTCILPNIISIGEMVVEKEEIFKIPSEQIGCISRLEEKLTLAQTIYEYKKLNYDYMQSLKLAPSLSNLFFSFEANNIKLEELKTLPSLDQAEHWYKIYDFLSYSFYEWHTKVKKLQKVTRAEYQRTLFSSELNRLRNSPNLSLIIAGIYSNNLITRDFIENAIKLNNVNLILPPYPYSTEESAIQSKIPKLIEYANLFIKESSNYVSYNSDNGLLLDNCVTKSESIKFDNKITSIEFENIFYEGEYIALKCREFLENNISAKIAIITHSQEVKEQYKHFLDKYSLLYHDQLGENILHLHPISFILMLAEQIYCEFNLKKFCSFLSHPLIYSEKSQELKALVVKQNKFTSSYQDVLDIVIKSNNQELIDYFSLLQKALLRNLESKEFTALYKEVILAAEELIPNIWDNFQEIIGALKELYQIQCTFFIQDTNEFPDILKQIFSGGRVSKQSLTEQIIITSSSSSALTNYDLIIITDMNDGSYPRIINNNPWINNSMQQKLNLDTKQDLWDESLYYFYLNIQNKNVILTRSKRDIRNKQILPSPFLLNLKLVLKDKLETKIGSPCMNQETSIHYPKTATAKDFPKELYVTDIETLIKSPYNFYAKKILKLRKIEEVEDKPNLAAFGNFFHSVVDLYAKAYEPTLIDKYTYIIGVAESVLENTIIPKNIKPIWKSKLEAIASEYIDFDELRRKNSRKIYSEIKGSAELDISGNLVKINAIADRVEISKKNEAIILDFKTGSVPTKKEIFSGLSPQLLIEAIILSENGFQIDGIKIETNVINIIYVKIGSSSPYITTSEFTISRDELEQHKQGLINLLKHYVQQLEFPIEYNIMKYDDYKHLARRY